MTELRASIGESTMDSLGLDLAADGFGCVNDCLEGIGDDCILCWLYNGSLFYTDLGAGLIDWALGGWACGFSTSSAYYTGLARVGELLTAAFVSSFTGLA